jgi:hypothetical protein
VDTSNLGTNGCLEGSVRKDCGKTVGAVVKSQSCTDPAGWTGTSEYSVVCGAASPWSCEYYVKYDLGDGTSDWNMLNKYSTETEARAYTYCKRTGGQSRTFGVSLSAEGLEDLKPATLTSGSICLLEGTNGPTLKCNDVNVGALTSTGVVNMNFTVNPNESVAWINATVFDSNNHTYQANVRTSINEYTPPQAAGYGLRININNPVK